MSLGRSGDKNNTPFPQPYPSSQASMEKPVVVLQSRCRQHSPHPVDIMKMKSQRVSSTELSRGLLQKNEQKKNCLPDTHYFPSHVSTDEGCEASEDTTTAPNFTISDNLGSTESAQELRHLIDAMKVEFTRLRNSKQQAEDKAMRLQTELLLQRKKNEELSVLLYAENEHLKAVANTKDKKLEQAVETIHQLENEIQSLKGKKERRKKHTRDRVGSHEKASKNSTIV